MTRGAEQFDLKPNESTYIPAGVAHRLRNDGTAPLVLLEVQSGTHVSEQDIVRLDDVYGRADPPDRTVAE